MSVSLKASEFERSDFYSALKKLTRLSDESDEAIQDF
jgi:hypothetical protein